MAARKKAKREQTPEERALFLAAEDAAQAVYDAAAGVRMPRAIKCVVVNGVEGPSLYINDYRVAGPKPWGGGRVLYSFEFTSDDLDRAVREAP